VAERDEAQAFFRCRLPRSLVGRFVAGERIDAALAATAWLSRRGLRTTLDHLGENVLTPDEARAAVVTDSATLLALAASGFEPNIETRPGAADPALHD
jgi:proline dehydrogenase